MEGMRLGNSGVVGVAKPEFGGPITRLRIHYHDPAEFLDTSKFADANVAAAICANVYDLEKVPLARFIHLVRDTESGCEVRSRFWLFRASEADAISLTKHALEEMQRLGVFLPDLYDRDDTSHGAGPSSVRAHSGGRSSRAMTSTP